MKLILTILLSGLSYLVTAQDFNSRKIKVLFLGNSFTGSIPSIIADMATTTGDELIFEVSYEQFLFYHAQEGSNSLNKIREGGWDYLVLQDQSQIPAWPDSTVEAYVYPSARYLDSVFNAYNPCGETMFYMTWGYKYGDPDNCGWYPPVCTYLEMDSMLRFRYMIMADTNNAEVSPVGAVWRYVRQNYPSIELYSPDEYHPSPEGEYTSAVTFYTAFFRKDPTLLSYNYTIDSVQAADIRYAAKVIVYDSLLQWHIGEYENPKAEFSYTTFAGNQVVFNNLSINADTYKWYFGDGDSSMAVGPTHVYATPGVYNVTLIALSCGKIDTLQLAVNLTSTGIPGYYSSYKTILYPNPADKFIEICLPFATEAQYTLIEISGKVLQQGNISGNRKILNIETLSKGLYFVHIIDKSGTISENFLVR